MYTLVSTIYILTSVTVYIPNDSLNCFCGVLFFFLYHIGYLHSPAPGKHHLCFIHVTVSLPTQVPSSALCKIANEGHAIHPQNNSMENAVRPVSRGTLNPPCVACYTQIGTVVTIIYHHNILTKLFNEHQAVMNYG